MSNQEYKKKNLDKLKALFSQGEDVSCYSSFYFSPGTRGLRYALEQLLLFAVVWFVQGAG